MEDTFRVLIVDDELGIRLGISRILKGFTLFIPEYDTEVKFLTEQVETGEEALEIIKSNPPDILLLDNKLPGISGMEVLETLAPLNLNMHTVIITAYASIEIAVRATKSGAFDFLPKPFTPLEIKATMEKVAQNLMISRRARELAAEKRKVRFQFISVLAHELKAPLNAVESYLRIIKGKSAGDNPKKYEELLERSLLRMEYMRKMINDLLDLTRIESGERVRSMVACDLVECARSAMDTIRPEAESRGISLSLQPETLVMFHADKTEMDIIFNNLLSNAVKYNRDHGSVNVDIIPHGDTVTINVQDTGIGMTQEECSRIFHDFIRIKNEKTTKILGSGLGLSTVKKIALLYDGNTTVVSMPDRGSTFTVMLKNTDKNTAILS
ncbi:MAG TPA: hybrid sensor histidine kinase/response regulator [Candidatus Hydrogenedentes bacterium]|nr:hybrid sensor histidine kinase/response regulator [Candidatus Hydrogenedentota bacterium]